MNANHITELFRILNWAQLNGASGTAAAAQEALAKAMAVVVTAHPVPLAS